MTSKDYYKYQLRKYMGEDFDRLSLPPRMPTLNDLSDPLLATILSHALLPRRDGFLASIMNTAKMNKKTQSARPAPNFLLVNKKFHRVGKQVWLQTDFCHIYMNSWAPLHRGLISCASELPFVVMTLDIRRGERTLGEKLVPSAFGAKLRELLHEMKSLEVFLIRVWHGLGSLGPVSEIIMNNFSGVRVGQAVNIASIIFTANGIDEDRGCPGLLSESYMENFVSHLLRKSPDPPHVRDLTDESMDMPLKDVPKSTTTYLDDSEPLLKIPIWRGCSAGLETADSVWLPALKEPGELKKDKDGAEEEKGEGEGRAAEDDDKMAQDFKEHMMDIPWVAAAARAAKRQEKARLKRDKKEKKRNAGEKTREEK